MTSSEVTDAPIYSTFGDDPDLGELVELFVSEMPERIEALSQFYQQTDWEGLGRIAHQLKGAAGSYGFDAVTPFAARLEALAKTGQPRAELDDAYEELAAVCGRLKEGAPT